jgi:quercetin dioxygenase-like cupin family protein
MLVGLYASTPNLTVGELRLLPGQVSDPQIFNGDTTYYLLTGNVFVQSQSEGQGVMSELAPDDLMYIPPNVEYRIGNLRDSPARLLFGVAPEGAMSESSVPQPSGSRRTERDV